MQPALLLPLQRVGSRVGGAGGRQVVGSELINVGLCHLLSDMRPAHANSTYACHRNTHPLPACLSKGLA
eukprot:366010-Chlamydomonas_euryale.AAC.6